MTISFSHFLGAILTRPGLLLATLLFLAFSFISAWTDAPNSLATALASYRLDRAKALAIAMSFNFLGALLVSTINMGVAQTIGQLVDFSPDPGALVPILTLALFVASLWSVATWYVGLPVSKTHALLSAMTGAAWAYFGLASTDLSQWGKVFLGLILAIGLGFGLALGLGLLMRRYAGSINKKGLNAALPQAQSVSCALMSFTQGGQGAQKFNAIIILILASIQGAQPDTSPMVPAWVPLTSALVLALGTGMGGLRIIRTLTRKMVRLQPYQALLSEVSTALVLGLMTLLGLPVSTTHTKTSAMLGSAANKKPKKIRPRPLISVLGLWALTFPTCTGLAYLLARLLLLF